MMIIAAAVFCVAAILAAFGWLLAFSPAHAIGWLAAAVLCLVLERARSLRVP